ncbi:MAG: hypothetical protein OEV78_11490, partial [Spirochaetia bacterium]|nr:hypothetical protein [Spirochaetia bacterium]
CTETAQSHARKGFRPPASPFYETSCFLNGITLGWLLGVTRFGQSKMAIAVLKAGWHFLRVFKPDVRTLVGTSVIFLDIYTRNYIETI